MDNSALAGEPIERQPPASTARVERVCAVLTDQAMRQIHSKLFALAIAITVTGCGSAQHGRGADGAPVATDRRLENLRAVASRHIACPLDGISVEPLTDQVWLARGCGDAREFAIIDAGRMAQWQPITPANVRASNELACPAERLVASAPTGAHRQVAGCGRSASYELACSPAQCEWVMVGQSGDWGGGSGVTVTPPGQVPPSSTPAPRPPVVVPDYGDRGGYRGGPGPVEPAVDQAVRQAIDAQRPSVFACVPRSAGVVVHARWGVDGLVQLSLEPPYAGTPTERCVREAIGTFQVTTGRPGALTHVVQ